MKLTEEVSAPFDRNNQLSSPGNEWLTAEEAAQYLKAKRRTVLLWVRQGKIRGFALSGTKRRVWRFLRKDLDAALRDFSC